MRISQPRRTRSLLSLTSLIDVIFLLLLFFMLTSVFMRFSSIELAASADAGGPGGAPGILIRIEEAGTVKVNGREVALAGLPAALEELHASGAARALIQAGDRADTQMLVDVTQALKASPITRVTLQR